MSDFLSELMKIMAPQAHQQRRGTAIVAHHARNPNAQTNVKVAAIARM
jgi:hypothetical protein